jgi:hypothetical protein
MRRVAMVNSAVSGRSSTALYTGSTRLRVVLVKIVHCHVRKLWANDSYRPQHLKNKLGLARGTSLADMRPMMATVSFSA